MLVASTCTWQQPPARDRHCCRVPQHRQEGAVGGAALVAGRVALNLVGASQLTRALELAGTVDAGPLLAALAPLAGATA